MMPLISLADGLARARQHRYALGAFNVLDTHFLRALFAAAKQERSPSTSDSSDTYLKCTSAMLMIKGERSCFAAANRARRKWVSRTLNAPSA